MKLVPFSIIKAAKESDMEAVSVIQRHFDDYIAHQCLNSYISADGNSHSFIDPDLRDQAGSALLSAIFVFRFKEPPDDFPMAD